MLRQSFLEIDYLLACLVVSSWTWPAVDHSLLHPSLYQAYYYYVMTTKNTNSFVIFCLLLAWCILFCFFFHPLQQTPIHAASPSLLSSISCNPNCPYTNHLPCSRNKIDSFLFFNSNIILLFFCNCIKMPTTYMIAQLRFLSFFHTVIRWRS